jgi:hypothetical protein
VEREAEMPLTYVGAGRVVAGVPARDLSDEEAEAAERLYPGFLAQVRAGAMEDGPTPVYAEMTKAEAKSWAAEQAEVAKARAEVDAVKALRRSGGGEESSEDGADSEESPAAESSEAASEGAAAGEGS